MSKFIRWAAVPVFILENVKCGSRRARKCCII